MFLRLFGAVYLAAFTSLGVQIQGLVGSKGIALYLSYVYAGQDFLSFQWDVP